MILDPSQRIFEAAARLEGRYAVHGVLLTTEGEAALMSITRDK
jgi:hypothetical protein